MKNLNRDVEKSIQRLIAAGTNFDIEALDRIYHDELQVFMIDADDNLSVSDKAAFKELFKTKKANNSPPLDTWAKFLSVSADETSAHVLVKRRVNLVDQDQELLLSIDLVNEDDRWQVIREVITARPTV